MGWYASEELDNAWEEAKDILFPFELGTWARLSLIVILTGHGVNMPNFPSSLPSDTGDTRTMDTAYGAADSADNPVTNVASSIPDLSMTGLATASPSLGSLIAVIVAVALALFLLFFYLSSVFEFIYYQSLLDKDVHIRKNFRRHAGKGGQYFLFRLAIIASVITAFIAAVIGIGTSAIFFSLLLALLVLLLLPIMVFLGLTHNFVLLWMMENDTGIIQAWKEFYPVLKREWKEVAVYLLLRLAIKIGLGVAGLAWAVLTLLILLIPFGILTFLFYLVTPVLAAIPVIIGFITWLVLLVGIQVVFQTYLYYYALLVYHDLTS